MKNYPILIVMLTQNDRTVMDAKAVFEECKDSKAQYFGFKEEPLPLSEMKELFAYMKKCGKKTALEVVAYSEEEGIAGAKTAVECGCDILMGSMYYDAVNEICKANGIKYMPYVGEITERPSVLDGSIEGMIAEAEKCIEKGVDGFDLLGYRVGYGGGYYDRFLANFKGTSVGICYSRCLCEECPKDIYDIAVDMIVTEKYF